MSTICHMGIAGEVIRTGDLLVRDAETRHFMRYDPKHDAGTLCVATTNGALGDLVVGVSGGSMTIKVKPLL